MFNFFLPQRPFKLFFKLSNMYMFSKICISNIEHTYNHFIFYNQHVHVFYIFNVYHIFNKKLKDKLWAINIREIHLCFLSLNKRLAPRRWQHIVKDYICLKTCFSDFWQLCDISLVKISKYNMWSYKLWVKI